MAYRDILFAPLTSVFLLEGLTPTVLERLPGALNTVVRTRASARRVWPGPTLRAHRVEMSKIAPLAERSVHREPDSLTDAQLIAAASAHGFSGLPIALTLTPTRCAVAVAHAVFDGSGALELIHDLLDSAAGEPLPTHQPAVRRPVLKALRRVRPDDARRWIDARRNRSDEAFSDTVPPATSEARSAAFSLSAADLGAIRRYREPNRVGRATLHSRLASLTIAALRSVETTGMDIPVWVTSDIRHLAGGPVDGNFITRERIGSLHGDEWAPGALAARLMRLKEPGQAISLVWSTTGWLLRSAVGKRPAAGEEIVLTFASTQRTFPVHVGRVTATSVGGSPTFAFVWQTRDAVHLSVFNSSGRFALDRFEATFRALVDQRADH